MCLIEQVYGSPGLPHFQLAFGANTGLPQNMSHPKPSHFHDLVDTSIACKSGVKASTVSEIPSNVSSPSALRIRAHVGQMAG
jgi:hypothetical protein